jgi:hypothetical protein
MAKIRFDSSEFLFGRILRSESVVRSCIGEAMKPDQPADLFEMALDGIRQTPSSERPSDRDVLALLASGRVPLAAQTPVRSRRRVMMRVVSWSLAVSVLLGVAGMFVFKGSSSIALADVLKAAEKHKLVKYKLSEAPEMKDGSECSPAVSVRYADLKSPRTRQVWSQIGAHGGMIDFESYVVEDNKMCRWLRVTTETITEKGKKDPNLEVFLKQWEKVCIPRQEAMIGKLDRQNGIYPDSRDKGKSILENLHALENHKNVVATKDQLDGMTVLKYRVAEEKTTTTLWVNPETKLPVKVECVTTEVIDEPVSRLTFVLSDFEWDPPIKGYKDTDEFFSTTPPKGYKVKESTKEGAKKKD